MYGVRLITDYVEGVADDLQVQNVGATRNFQPGHKIC
jgi:hypothetical protein